MLVNNFLHRLNTGSYLQKQAQKTHILTAPEPEKVIFVKFFSIIKN